MLYDTRMYRSSKCRQRLCVYTFSFFLLQIPFFIRRVLSLSFFKCFIFIFFLFSKLLSLYNVFYMGFFSSECECAQLYSLYKAFYMGFFSSGCACAQLYSLYKVFYMGFFSFGCAYAQLYSLASEKKYSYLFVQSVFV